MNTARLPDLPPIPTREIGDSEFRQVRSRFVPPMEYESARHKLTPSLPLLIVTGGSGSGKRTLALRLLWDRSGRLWDEGVGALTIRELVPDWEEPNVQRLPVERERGYLLDLGHRDDPRPVWPFAKALRDYADELRSAGSYLVVTATDEHWQDCEGVLDQARVRTAEPPPARAVVRQRIRADREAWLGNPRLSRLLDDGLPPADAVRLADAIARAPGADGSGVEHALNEYLRGRWRPYLDGWFENHPSLADRALLVAAAVLDGSSADEICGAGTALLRVMSGDGQATGPLVGPGRTRLLEILDIPDLEPGGPVSLVGLRPGLDGAVIDYVLEEHPKLTPYLWHWIDDSALTATNVAQRVGRVAHVLASRSVRHRKPVFLNRLPRLDSARPGPRRLAGTLLEQTVLDPVVGASVRRRIALWAERRSTREPLLGAVAAVCGGVLAGQFPTVALATLRTILLRRDSTANEHAALAALVRMAGPGGHRRLVLNTVVRWTGHRAHRYAGGVGFLRLLRPGAGSVASRLANDDADDPQVFCLLRVGWQRLAGTGVPEAQVTELMQAWVSAAGRRELRRDVVADLLLLALEDDVRRLAAGVLPADPEAAAGTGNGRVELVRSVLDLRRGG